MLEHGLVTRTYSEWSPPVILQLKPDGKVRFPPTIFILIFVPKLDGVSMSATT